MRKMLDKMVRPFGLRVVKARQTEMVYQHAYAGGYQEYRDVQIHHNKRKLDSIWADDTTLSVIADDIRAHGLGATGICHGARNGFEVAWFRKALSGEVIGTDISETAEEFPNMHVWDFQDENPDWADSFGFVYTNSLDQAMEPKRALASWSRQLKPGGRIYIEHTMAHSAEGAGEMDPFGAHPMAMPYLFFRWGRGEYQMVDILDIPEKGNMRKRVWVFVLERI
jgi:SAM-dependent methyltransferase